MHILVRIVPYWDVREIDLLPIVSDPWHAFDVRNPVTDSELILTVTSDGIDFRAKPGEEVTFGRSRTATIHLASQPSDRLLHRVAGVFRFDHGRWEVRNDGEKLPLHIEVVGGLVSTVNPGPLALPLPWGAVGVVRIVTTRTYSLNFRIARGPISGYVTSISEFTAPTEGLRESLGLTADEDRMLVALCEPRLLDPTKPAWVVPEYQELCSRLGGIPKKKAEDLVDGLVGKFSSVLPDLIGDSGARQQYRRQMIVELCLLTRCVTRADLKAVLRPGEDVP